jgi:hypothetical protein
LGTLAGLWWGLQAEAWGWRQAVMLVALWCLVALAGARWWRAASGQLRWDGQAWSWSAAQDGAACRAQLVLDFQSVLLLRLADGDGRPVAWLWPEQRRSPARWKALRRALVSSAAPRALDAPGAATEQERA